MLKYFIAVTENLIATAVLLGLLYACMGNVHGSSGRKAIAAGTLGGVAAAAVMAYLKNQTSLIHTGIWNVRIFIISLIALALFASFYAVREKTGVKGELIRVYCAGILAFTFVFYAMPDTLAYPFTISLNGSPVFSTFYLMRLIGWLLGLILVFITFLAIENAARRSKYAVFTMAVALGINALSQISKILQVLVTRRILKDAVFFQIARYSSNYGDWFIYAVLLAALIAPVKLLLDSLRVQEPYENPAQYRKIRAKWRDARRWSCTAAACFLVATLCVTVLKSISSRPVQLSPIEESELIDNTVRAPLFRVNDGHLHRFAYTTPNGKEVRFIVIKKPNSSSYGVGLDACEICGETGYYERNGQVVCGLCDVVMNINTIGFKGGCNPIVIDYSVENGNIVVPVSTLIEHENEFK